MPLRVLALTGVLAMGATGLMAGPARAAPARHPGVCSGEIHITHMAFRPRSVRVGRASTVSVDARNCTASSQQTSVMWLGRFEDATGNLAPGCPVIDPITEPVDFAPHGRARSHLTYDTLTGCTATRLRSTAEFLQNGHVLAERSADLRIIGPKG